MDVKIPPSEATTLGELYLSNQFQVATQKEFTNDSAEKQAVGGIKYDGGKAPVFRGGLGYFPRAIREVSSVSGFGASKYAWKGWEQVDDGFNRYSDAMVRHLGYEGQGEVLDLDSGLLHAAHTAWNALARLELLLREKENESCQKSPISGSAS